MILYNGKKYNYYYDLAMSLIKDGQDFNEVILPTSKVYFCKIALESKFNRKFTIKEVKKLIKDMPKAATPVILNLKSFAKRT